MRPSASVRTWATRSAWLVGALLLPGPARGDDPPPLAPPAGLPAPEAPSSTPSPSEPATTPTPAVAAPLPPGRADRPVLMLPGVTIPSARPVPPPAPPPPSLASSPDGGLPALTPPSGISSGRAATSTPLPALPSSRFRGRVIESTPADSAPPTIDMPLPAGSGLRGSVPLPMNGMRRFGDPDEIDERDFKELGGPKRSDAEVEKDRLRGLPSSLPARRGFFGTRWVNPFAARGLPDDSDSGIRAEPRTDPAADATLKRRIEKQAAGAVGDRVRSVEVHVVGRSITIQARGAKFLQRRAVRRSLEGLPGLSGYRSVVELVD